MSLKRVHHRTPCCSQVGRTGRRSLCPKPPQVVAPDIRCSDALCWCLVGVSVRLQLMVPFSPLPATNLGRESPSCAYTARELREYVPICFAQEHQAV